MRHTKKVLTAPWVRAGRIHRHVGAEAGAGQGHATNHFVQAFVIANNCGCVNRYRTPFSKHLV
jgi:hypothetical protein